MAKTPAFSCRRFLKTHFETPDLLLLDLIQFGERRPSREQVRKWFERDSMPGEWLAVILYSMELRDGKMPALGPFVSTMFE